MFAPAFNIAQPMNQLAGISISISVSEGSQQALRRVGIWALASIPLLSILWRWLERSIFYPGWDILGAAYGQYLVSTGSLWEAITTVFWRSRHFQYWNQTDSLFYGLIPGIISSAFPWEFWAHAFSLLTFGIIVLLLLRISTLPKKHFVFLALLLGSSPAILSFSIAGHPIISGLLPHALAFALLCSVNLRKRPILSFILGLLIIELSWHAYEIGKTVFLPFFLAAAFIRPAPLITRAGWAALGVTSLALVLQTKGSNVDYILSSAKNLASFTETVRNIFSVIFIDHRPDLPILSIVALISVFLIRENRWFWIFSLLAQWSIILVLGFVDAEGIRPRRFLTLQFYNILISLIGVHNLLASGNKTRVGKQILTLIYAVLALGTVWQVAVTASFYNTGPLQRNRALPYTHSGADYYVNPPLVSAASDMVYLANKGKKIILLYSFLAYAENTTDMTALPERLYLALGDQSFRNHILIFSQYPERYSRVPIHPLTNAERVLSEIDARLSNGEGNINEYLVLDYTGFSSEKLDEEIAIMKSAIAQHFNLLPFEFMDFPQFDAYSISIAQQPSPAPRSDDNAAPE